MEGGQRNGGRTMEWANDIGWGRRNGGGNEIERGTGEMEGGGIQHCMIKIYRYLQNSVQKAKNPNPDFLT